MPSLLAIGQKYLFSEFALKPAINSGSAMRINIALIAEGVGQRGIFTAVY